MPKDTKNKKENKRFLKDFKAELKKVIWPTPKQLLNNTVAVITIVLITAVIVFALDSVFKVMNTYGINKIKEAVDARNEVSDESVDDESKVEEETKVEGETTSEGTESEQAEEQEEATTEQPQQVQSEE